MKPFPKPRNKTELELLTKWYFGKELHITLSIYGCGGQYEVVEDYSSYHGKGWLFGKNDGVGYDYSRRFWNYVIGPLCCGGIGRASYGQFTINKGYREKLRLENLIRSLRLDGPDPVRKSFTRLAADKMGRREWVYSR